MNFESFANEFLYNLRKDDKQAISILNNNIKIVQEYLGDDANPKTMDHFVQDLVQIVIQTHKGKFGVIESALKHQAMANVYYHFKNSDVLIKAFQIENKHAIKWLFSMQVSPYVQDDDGRNALMFAAQNSQWNNYIEQFATDTKCINQVDKYGRNALFYALNNIGGLMELMKYDIDINHQDCEGNNVLLYCCKNDIYNSLKFLVNNNVDVNAIDHEERTIAMYLAIKGKHSFISILHSKGCDFNYMNSKGETVLSLLLQQMYGPESDKNGMYTMYVRTIIALVFTDCNFNVPVDEDENTPLMVFLLVNDLDTFRFVVKFNKTVDLSIKNRNGENATSLFIKNKKGNLFHKVIYHPTFDLKYVDPIYRNNILMLTAITHSIFIPKILEYKPGLLNEVNIKGENALIVACKANKNDSVITLMNQCSNYSLDINCQDCLGNTALHYAVAHQNPVLVYHLMQHGADSIRKNYEGKSAFDLAMTLGDPHVLEALHGRMTTDLLKKITPLYQGEDKRNPMIAREVEEYLYSCGSITSYSNFEMTKSMLKTEKSHYQSKENEIVKDYSINDLVLLGLFFTVI
jgi:ankyrin repeat protein